MFGRGLGAFGQDCGLYRIDPSTAEPTLIGNTGFFDLRGLAFDPLGGSLWASSNLGEIYRLNPATGDATLLSNAGVGPLPDIAFDNDGNFYGVAGGAAVNNNLVSLDPIDGSGSLIGPVDFRAISGLAARNESLTGRQLGVLPKSLNFGNVLIDSTSGPRTLRLRSLSTDTVTVSAIERTGSAAFTLLNLPALPRSLAPGEQLTFQVVYSPTDFGFQTSLVEISSDDEDEPVKRARLTGFGRELPSAGTLFASTASSGDLIIIDPSSGSSVLVARIQGGLALTEIEFRQDTVLFGTSGGGASQLMQVDDLTGDTSLVGNHPFGAINGMEFSPGGTLFGTYIEGPNTPSQLVRVNTDDASLVVVGNTGFNNIGGLAFSGDGVLYGITSGSNGGDLLVIDTLSGQASLIGATGFTSVGSLEFSPEGRLFAGLGQNEPDHPGALIEIDPATAAATVIGATGYSAISGLAFFPDLIVSTEEFAELSAQHITLLQNAPNPFQDRTAIPLLLSRRMNVQLEVFNVQGQRLHTLWNGPLTEGLHQFAFDGSDLPNGVYLCRLQADTFVTSIRMIRTR